MTNPHTLTQARLDLVHDEQRFALRDPDEAPRWLKIVCGILMVVIWGATFYAIGAV